MKSPFTSHFQVLVCLNLFFTQNMLATLIFESGRRIVAYFKKQKHNLAKIIVNL